MWFQTVMLHLLHVELIGHLTLDLLDTQRKSLVVQFCSSFENHIMMMGTCCC